MGIEYPEEVLALRREADRLAAEAKRAADAQREARDKADAAEAAHLEVAFGLKAGDLLREVGERNPRIGSYLHADRTPFWYSQPIVTVALLNKGGKPGARIVRFFDWMKTP